MVAPHIRGDEVSLLERFYGHPRQLAYNFGPQHPLKPERLRRTFELAEALGVSILDPGVGDVHDVLRVHDPAYVDAIQRIASLPKDEAARFGLGPGDNPIFPDMHCASMAYVAGSVAAAKDVRDGAPLAYGIAGGLHHARHAMAHGFCVYNDCAIALSILRERFERVAYVDIDVHHGCGVQWLFWEDPTVMTCSIHQDGRTLYPGSGHVDETSVDHTAVNVPLYPGTSGDVWLWAFREGILPALKRFQPQAIVLQMGTDSHATDPLARIENTVQEWLLAVGDIRDFGVPIVALGGGGYALEMVPRMWMAACLTLAGHEVPDELPTGLGEAWGTPRYLDAEPLSPREVGMIHAKAVVNSLSW